MSNFKSGAGNLNFGSDEENEPKKEAAAETTDTRSGSDD